MAMDAEPNLLLLSYDEARFVALGGISRTTLWELINRGELTRVKIGSRAFITTESIAAYVERLKVAAGAP